MANLPEEHLASASAPCPRASHVSNDSDSLPDDENGRKEARQIAKYFPKESRIQELRSWPSREVARRDDHHNHFIEDETALGHLATTTRTRTRSRGASNLPPPPDGGLQAWTQVAAGWLVIFATWGYLNSFGSFQSYYTTTALPFQSPSSISWIGSIQAFLTTAIGAFSGRLLDAGLFRPTFAIGAVLQLAGLFAMSAFSSPPYWYLMLTQGVLTGLGGGILFTPTLALVATWFGRRRGLAIGLATTGNSAGGIVYPLIVKQLIPRVGFAWTARALGFVNMACFALALTLARSRLPPRRSGPLIDWSAFREGVYVTYVAGLLFFVWANSYVFYYCRTRPWGAMLTSLPIASFGIQRLGLSYADASILVMVVNGAGLPARVLMPMLADHIGPLNVITGSTICLTVIVVSWFGVSDVAGLYAFTAVCGLASGAVQSLMPTTIASITRRLDTVGVRLGMCFTVLSFASLTGPPVGGALQSATGGSFTGPQVWAAISTLVGALFLVLSRFLKMGWDIRRVC